MFSKTEAKQYIDKLLKKHKITVHGWSTTSSGHAIVKARSIKIPAPTNVDRFAVCLHEIFHVIGRKGSKSFEKEFYCDMYARGILVELGYETEAWDKRTKWHILSRIAMAHNRGLNHSSINAEIRQFFQEVDFSKWHGNKVFVGHAYWKAANPADIELTPALSRTQIVEQLTRKGLQLDKSNIDDSTYGSWLIMNGGECIGYHDNLSSVIKKYNLTA